MPLLDDATQPIRNKGFTAFIATQFLGAFNDNTYKQMVLLFGLWVMAEDRQGLATVLFALPFILFSGYAGQLSERYPKTSIMRLAKLAEIGIMGLGALGFFLGSQVVVFLALFLMGSQSALFGPAKLGIIGELVGAKALLRANGWVMMTTFAAVIMGSALGGLLLKSFADALFLAGSACVLVAVAGTVAVFAIPPSAANRPNLSMALNPFGRLGRNLRSVYDDRALLWAFVAGTFFFFSGALVTLCINHYGTVLLQLQPHRTSLLLVSLVGGLMIGCGAAPWLRRWLSSRGLVAFGCIGVVFTEFLLYFYFLPLPLIHLILFFAGMATGLYYVPIATFIQARPALGRKGEILGAYHFCNYVGIMLAGSVWKFAVIDTGMPIPWVWWGLAGSLGLLMGFMLPRLGQMDDAASKH